MAKSLGGALTGQDDETDGGLKNIVSSAGQGIESFLPQDPESRSALLQIGLGLMQPVAIGQSLAGHVGQAIGSGGEAVGRIEKEDLDAKKADDKLSVAERNMTIRQQMADAATERAHRTLGEMTQYQREKLKFDELRNERSDAKEARKETLDSQRSARQARIDAAKEKAAEEDRIDELAKNAYKASRSLVGDDNDPDMRFKTQDLPAIRETIAKERAARRAPVETEPTSPNDGAKPATIRQKGVTYSLQPDGTYK